MLSPAGTPSFADRYSPILRLEAALEHMTISQSIKANEEVTIEVLALWSTSCTTSLDRSLFILPLPHTLTESLVLFSSRVCASARISDRFPRLLLTEFLFFLVGFCLRARIASSIQRVSHSGTCSFISSCATTHFKSSLDACITVVSTSAEQSLRPITLVMFESHTVNW